MITKTNHRCAVTCSIAVCLCMSQAKLYAQRAIEEERPIPVQRLRLNFGGGSLSQYAELLRREAPDFNIILTREVANFDIGPVRLNNVSPATAVNILESLSDGNLSIDYDRGGTLVIIGSNVTAGHVEVETIGDLILEEKDERTGDGRVTLNEFLSAVEAALEFVRSPEPATMKVHPETGLFIVSGHPAQVEMVSTVVNKIRSAREKAQSSEVARLVEELKAKDRDLQRYMYDKDQRIRSLTRSVAQKEDQLRKLEEQLREQRLKSAE